MAYTLAHALPFVFEIGVSSVPSASVRADDNTVPTITAATFTLRDGSDALVDAAAASSLGPPVTYSLAGSVTSGRVPSERALVTWSMTIGGLVYPMRRGAYIVRTAFVPTLTDDDLLSAHRDLEDYRHPDETSFERYRVLAQGRMERDLIKKGRRPWLIFDPAALFDAHMALTLYYVFNDARSSAGNGEAKEHAAEYLTTYGAEMASVTFREDINETGTIDETTQRAAIPAVLLNAGPSVGAFATGNYRRAL